LNLDRVRRELNGCGLNLFSVLDHRSLSPFDGLAEFRSLIVIGNSGPSMWQKIPAAYFERDHPVDDFATKTVQTALEKSADPGSWQVLFPGTDERCPPLQALGRAVGWHRDSPLGTGINAEYGLWFAYRSVVGVTIDLEGSDVASVASPCLSCESRACVSQCPASALSFASAPDLSKCAEYRVSADCGMVMHN